MHSERIRMIEQRSHAPELFGWAALVLVGIAWPLYLLATGGF